MKTKQKNSKSIMNILLALLFLFAIAAGASCGGGSRSGGDGGTSGGGDSPPTIITGPDNTKLTIPNNAVSPDTTYRIARNSDGAPSTDGLILLSPIYEATPHSQTFSENALIEIPYDQSQAPSGSVPFMLRADAGGQWQAFGNARLSNGTAKADISSLSYYAIGVCAQDFSSPGDCPFNSELKLELLDSSGNAIPVQFNSWGLALPVITVDQPTTLNFRTTWTRPPNINRTDNIWLYLSGGGQLQTSPYQVVLPNMQVYDLNYRVYIDPATVSGASGPNGKIVRLRASVFGSYLAFVGPPEGFRNIQWEMLTEIAVRVRYAGVQPTITQQPAHQSVTAGQTATFSVAASGANLTYQWQRSNDNGQSFSNISGATAASYTTAATTTSDNGALFFVRVCSGSACVDSWAAGLTVTASCTPTTFAMQPASISVVAGQSASFTAVAAGPPAPSVQWYKFDGFLGIHVGTPCSSSGSSTACTYTTPLLTLADSGTQYYAVATSCAGSAQSNTVTVTVNSAPVAPSITTQPSDVTVSAGSDATFSVVANGTGRLSYQWRRNGVNITGANGTIYRVRNAQLSDNGAAFSVEVRNSAGSVTSRNAILTVTASSSGSLDAAFGTGGFVVHSNAAGGNGIDSGLSIITDSSGRILVSGRSRNSAGNFDMVIWRYNSNGTLDATFGTGGIVVHNSAAGGNSNDYGDSITTDSSGRILVAGRSYNGSSEDMVIWRYNPNGTLDTTFNGTGIVVHNNAAGGNSGDSGNSITIDSSGRILVAGYSTNAVGNLDMVIWRYNSNGTLDTTFNGTGIVVHSNAAGGNGLDIGQSITTDSSGRILVTGNSWGGATSVLDMVIWRYNSDGTLDTTFNGTGIVVHSGAAGGNSGDSGNSITIDSSGRILVAGYSTNAVGNLDMVIWRYNSNGTLDTTFNGTGIVVHSNAAGGNNTVPYTSFDFGFSITTDSSGRILVTGRSNNGSNEDMVIWRYNSNGTLDTTFDTDGFVVHGNAAGGDGLDTGYSIITDSSGRILVAGNSWNGTNNDMTIWRYMP